MKEKTQTSETKVSDSAQKFKRTERISDKMEKQVEKTSQSCNDDSCQEHGSLKIRGRIFRGYVIRKFPKRIVIEFERIVSVPKYERYAKRKTKIHARLPVCKENEVSIGDYVEVGECRPISKIIHFVYLGKVKEAGK